MANPIPANFSDPFWCIGLEEFAVPENVCTSKRGPDSAAAKMRAASRLVETPSFRRA